jgi:uncharacterized membrane protein YfhO
MINLNRKLHLAPGIKFMIFVSLLCLALFGKYIFGGFVYIFTDIGCDTIDQYFPSLFFNTRLLQDSFAWYSFNLGLGTSILNFNHYIFDPFSFFLYFLPKESISSGIVYSIILKIFFVSWFSYKFFKELLPDANEFVSWIGAISVAFSGFFILWGQHYFLSSTFAWFPFLLYGFELLLSGKRKDIFIIAVALLAMSIFAFYQCVIFFTVYALIRVFTSERFENIKLKLLFIAKVLLPLSVIGVLLVSFSVFPSFIEIRNNPRINTESFHFLRYLLLSPLNYLGNSFLRLFSNNFWGCGAHYFGFINYYESPQLYSSLLVLLLIPQAFFVKDRKLIPLVVIFSLFIVLLFVSPFLSFVLNGFQYASFRWGMLSNMALVILGIIGLLAYTKSITRLKKTVLVVTAFLYLVLILIVVFQLKQFDFRLQIVKVIIFFTSYVAILILFARNPKFLFPAIFIVLLIDIFVEHNATINHRKILKNNFEEKGQYYFDGCKDIVDSISKKDSSFYRIIKSDYSKFLNDPQIQGYNGVTSYNSINDPSYIRFLRKTNVPFYLPGAVNYIGQYGDRPILYDLFSVKYSLNNQFSSEINLVYADSIKQKYCYLRPNALPLGFTYDSYLLEDSIKAYSDSLLLKTVILAEYPGIVIKNVTSKEDLIAWTTESKKSADIARSNEQLIGKKNLYSKLTRDKLTVTYFKPDHIKGTIKVDQNKLLFLSILYNEGWKITCNGQKVKPLLANFGFMALPLEKGNYNIEMKFFPYSMKAGIAVSVITLLLVMFFFVKKHLRKDKK